MPVMSVAAYSSLKPIGYFMEIHVNSWKFVFIKSTCVRIVSTYYFMVTYSIFSPKRIDKMM